MQTDADAEPQTSFPPNVNLLFLYPVFLNSRMAASDAVCPCSAYVQISDPPPEAHAHYKTEANGRYKIHSS